MDAPLSRGEERLGNFGLLLPLPHALRLRAPRPGRPRGPRACAAPRRAPVYIFWRTSPPRGGSKRALAPFDLVPSFSNLRALASRRCNAVALVSATPGRVTLNSRVGCRAKTCFAARRRAPRRRRSAFSVRCCPGIQAWSCRARASRTFVFLVVRWSVLPSRPRTASRFFGLAHWSHVLKVLVPPVAAAPALYLRSGRPRGHSSARARARGGRPGGRRWLWSLPWSWCDAFRVCRRRPPRPVGIYHNLTLAPGRINACFAL